MGAWTGVRLPGGISCPPGSGRRQNLSPIDTALQELAGIRSDRDPIVTLYLDTRWSDQSQRDRIRLFVQDKLRWARDQVLGEHVEAFQKTLDRVDRYVDDLCRQVVEPDAHGMAIFACEGLNLFRTMAFGQSYQNQFSISETPHLLQLARFADDYEPVIVAVVDGGGAWVFETAVGAVVADARIQHESPKGHKMGGWSQFRFQRRIRHQIERNHREAAQHVAFLFDQSPESHLVLVGPERVVAAFEKVLPERVLDRLLTRLPNPRDLGAGDGKVRDQVMLRVVDELLAHERELESRSVEVVTGEALAGGLAVLGPQDVVLAANEGRIHRLLIEDGFSQSGWRCGNCDAIGMGAIASCGYCGHDVGTVDLGEELARRVIGSDGEVDVVDPQARLHHYYGIAAVLRHRGTINPGIGWAIEQPVF